MPLLISPLAIALPEALTTNTVSAASNCSYDSKNSADWHQEVSSFNLTGSSDDEFLFSEDGENRDDGGVFWNIGMGDNIYNSSELDAL